METFPRHRVIHACQDGPSAVCTPRKELTREELGKPGGLSFWDKSISENPTRSWCQVVVPLMRWVRVRYVAGFTFLCIYLYVALKRYLLYLPYLQ